MKWLKWLFGIEDDEKKSCCVAKDEVKGFFDPETGRVYKTAGSLKAAQTRRRNKAKKAKKAKK